MGRKARVLLGVLSGSVVECGKVSCQGLHVGDVCGGWGRWGRWVRCGGCMHACAGTAGA